MSYIFRILTTNTNMHLFLGSKDSCEMLLQNKELRVGLPGRLHLLEYMCPVLLAISQLLSEVSSQV